MWHASLLQACPSLQAWSPGEGSWPQSTLHLWPCWRERVPSRWVSPTQASSACGMNRTTTSMASPTTRMTWRGYREEAQVSSRCWDKVEFFLIFFLRLFLLPGVVLVLIILLRLWLWCFYLFLPFPAFRSGWMLFYVENVQWCLVCRAVQNLKTLWCLFLSLCVKTTLNLCELLFFIFYFFKAILSVKSATKPSLVELLYFYNSNAAYFIHLMNKYILCCHFFSSKTKMFVSAGKRTLLTLWGLLLTIMVQIKSTSTDLSLLSHCLSPVPLGSGGEGSILGAAGSVIGVGSDIGGSIRMPCFFNGIFGHKTTPGKRHWLWVW